MIVTVCLNACIDKTVEIGEFNYGSMNRILAARRDGSGKGVNVALAARELGLESACIGFLPENDAEPVTDRLSSAGCEWEFIRIPGSVRVNTKVLDRSCGVITELNEAGPPVTEEHMQQMLDLAAKWGREGSVIVMTGSLPPGCPPDFYESLISRCSAKAVLDAEGEKLTYGLKARPFLIKPNDYELGLAMGRKLFTVGEIYTAVRELLNGGPVMAAVSMGERGAVFTDGNRGWYSPRIDIEAMSSVGAGDCMVAGMLYALDKGMDAEEVFRCAVAGGTAGCLTPGTELLRKPDFLRMLERVEFQYI